MFICAVFFLAEKSSSHAVTNILSQLETDKVQALTVKIAAQRLRLQTDDSSVNPGRNPLFHSSV
jgi:hypothetical protein